MFANKIFFTQLDLCKNNQHILVTNGMEAPTKGL